MFPFSSTEITSGVEDENVSGCVANKLFRLRVSEGCRVFANGTKVIFFHLDVLVL